MSAPTGPDVPTLVHVRSSELWRVWSCDGSHPSLTCGFYAYWSGVPVDGVEFFLRQGRDIVVFPTHDDLTCIWVGRANGDWSAYRGHAKAVYLASLDPALLERGRRETAFRGTHRLPNFYRDCRGPGWALVGDASNTLDVGRAEGSAATGGQLLRQSY